MPKPITILIPTYNRASALEAVLPSYMDDPYVERVVIVDDGSTDHTAALVKELARTAPVPLELISHGQRRGQQAARMVAVDAARTPWVLFGEDDVWLTQNYCRTLLEEATRMEADAIAGRLVTARVPDVFRPGLLADDVQETEERDVFDMRMLDADFSLRPSKTIPAPHLHTIALIRRQVLRQVSFDTRYAGNGWREETDFYFALNAAGGKVFFTPHTLCYHIRGPISAAGGQRMSRAGVEYYAFRNTLLLVSKHWDYLSKGFGFAGSPFLWTLGFLVRRQARHLLRIVQEVGRSAFRSQTL